MRRQTRMQPCRAFYPCQGTAKLMRTARRVLGPQNTPVLHAVSCKQGLLHRNGTCGWQQATPFGAGGHTVRGLTHLKKVTGMQPRMMARQTRALSWVLPGGHTQNTERRMSSSVSCAKGETPCPVSAARSPQHMPVSAAPAGVIGNCPAQQRHERHVDHFPMARPQCKPTGRPQRFRMRVAFAATMHARDALKRCTHGTV